MKHLPTGLMGVMYENIAHRSSELFVQTSACGPAINAERENAMEFPDFGAAILSRRVEPPLPPGCVANIVDDRETAVADVEGDETSSWSFFLRYDGGTRGSDRRITLRRIEAEGSRLISIRAFCHEARQMRHFRLDRIVEVVDIVTGEVMDMRQFGDHIMSRGAAISEVRLALMAKCLVFIARCDGHMHHAEWDQIELSIIRLCRSLLNSDIAAETHIEEVRRIAPDGRDFLKSLGNLTRTRLPARIHSEFRRALAQVIEADAVQHPEEVRWAVQAADYISRMPTTG